jgi:putative transposase
MIDRQHDLPITKQAEVLCVSRGSVYYLPRPGPEADLAIMRRIDRLHLENAEAGLPTEWQRKETLTVNDNGL